MDSVLPFYHGAEENGRKYCLRHLVRLGTALIAIIGSVYFNEPMTLVKLVSLGLVIIGVFSLNLSGGAH